MPKLTPPPDWHPRTPRLKLPQGSVDCHLHMFGPISKYAFAPDASYVSGDATADMYFKVQDTLGLSRAVLVSGGGYGQTFEHLADTLAAHPDRLRGIVRLPRGVTDKDLARLDKLGVKGIRIFSRNIDDLTPELLARISNFGWHVQFYSKPDQLLDHADFLERLDHTVVLDHFAHSSAHAGLESPLHKALLRLLDTGRFWVKISGPMRITNEEPPYPSVIPVARSLIAHAPERLVWGSDWPHTNMWDRTMPNDAVLIDMLAEWVSDESTLNRILVQNPSELYGFR
ncbi:amidohydrolase family protein [Candidimonas nitroreducens]|uniref:amidohydrolase family protein n=1 Tax=Candidimonas nitroreducens TaxID=683354 RepID=UPI001E32C177|nr:amidohydrolase family protein [Candidimonas nitroreducens]